jgi:hypothetical protein
MKMRSSRVTVSSCFLFFSWPWLCLTNVLSLASVH